MHRFHPLSGQDFEFVAHGWTDAAPADPFVVIADGSCPFTTGGLLALADLVGRLRSLAANGEAVKQIMP